MQIEEMVVGESLWESPLDLYLVQKNARVICIPVIVNVVLSFSSTTSTTQQFIMVVMVRSMQYLTFH